MENNLKKYPRTYHLPWSEAITSDDKICQTLSHFEGREVVVTEKMDGENTTLYQDHLHARSLDSRGGEDRAWVKQFWSQIRSDIPEGWRICGENLWAKHSVSYTDLRSYFYGFSIWDSSNMALSWDDTVGYFDLIGVTPVPALYRGVWDETTIRNLSRGMNLEQTEGYVVRLADSFHYDSFSTSVAKFVRKGHVQTDKHWRSQTFVPNSLSL